MNSLQLKYTINHYYKHIIINTLLLLIIQILMRADPPDNEMKNSNGLCILNSTILYYMYM